MSDGGWYGYPQQEPDPYAQAQDDWNQPPLDYSNPPQAPGYPSYGQTGAQSAAQYYDYPQQQQQPQQPQQQPRPPQQDPRYRQQQQRPQQNPQYPQQGQGQQQGQQGYASGSYDTGYDTGGYGGQSGQQRQQYSTGQQPRVGYDGYPASGYDTGSYGSGSYNAGSSGSYGNQGYASGGYETGAQQQRPPARPRRPAGPGQTDAYGEPRDARGARDPYNDLAEFAEDPGEYEYPARGGRRRAEPEQPGPSRSGSNPRYAPADEESERTSLLTADSGDSDGDSGGKRSGSGKKEKGNRRKSCLVVFVLFSILAGLLGYGGVQGYKWYQSKYGPPPDFASSTGATATVVVQIPDGSGGTAIGSILFQDDVVKSQRAFTKACEANPKCGEIQANTYLLHKEMSAAAAVNALLDTNNIDNTTQLLVRPGERAADVFKDLEQKKGWTQAQVLSAISGGKVDLPSWANAKTGAKFPFANVEGLLFTGTYQLPDYKDPTSLIKTMIDKQLAMFDAVGLTSKAKAAGGANLTPYQVLTLASMARAEAGTDTKDLGKISGVIYHRLKDTADFAHLGFDTTTLYGMGETTTQPDNKDSTNPYNTSVFGIKGLPPGPIDSVDQTTLEAALNPTDTTDLYFCAVDGSVLYAANSTAWATLGKAHPGLCGN